MLLPLLTLMLTSIVRDLCGLHAVNQAVKTGGTIEITDKGIKIQYPEPKSKTPKKSASDS